MAKHLPVEQEDGSSNLLWLAKVYKVNLGGLQRMNELVATYKFVDINGKDRILLSSEKLTHNEWQVLVNKHNIEILNKRCIAYDFAVKDLEAMGK